MNAMAGENAHAESEGGPMWGRFFDSIGHDDTESVVSGSHHAPTDLRSYPSMGHLQSSHSEVHPDDSASVMDDDAVSALEGYPRHKGLAVPGSTPVPVDDGTYVFKFRTPSGRTHRFQSRHDDVEHLREIVTGKLTTDPFFTEYHPSEEDHEEAHQPDPADFVLSYTDADGDTVLITSDHDVTDAVKIARGAGTDRVVLFVQGGKGWAEAGAGKSGVKAAEVTAAAAKEVREVEKAEGVTLVVPPAKATNTTIPGSTPTPSVPQTSSPPHERGGHHDKHHNADEVFGIPKDLLLPASIGALAVVIIGVFAISRLTSNNY
jgi:PB1 domain